MIEIKMTPSQIVQAGIVGVLRQSQNIQKRRAARYGASDNNDWQLHIEGCLGEMAVAFHFGLFWDGKVGIMTSGDVGKIEVRTRSEPRYSLIVHHTDNDDSRFVLVTGKNGDYCLRGWMFGRVAKDEKWWSDPSGQGRPAYFVPAEELRDMTEWEQ